MTEGTRRFGAYEVTVLVDGVFEPGVEIITHLDGPAAAERVRAAWGRPTLAMDVNAFLLRGPDGITLIDAGCGTDWPEPFGKVREGLRAAGVRPEDVRRVLLTHVHPDHAGGLFDGDRPYFPAAEVYAPEVDLAYLADSATRAAAPEAMRTVFALADRVSRAYAGRLHGFASGAVLPGIEARPLPGHTRGHSGFLLADPAQSLLVWGDLLHMDPLQARDPRVEVIWDLDPVEASRTRQATLEAAVREGWLVTGGHVRGFGVVRPEDRGFRIEPA